jgi:Tfp pilus assembly protein PilZ
MRSVQVQFPSGREVLSSYWGFLKNGGLVLREPKDLNEGDSVLLDVKIKSLKQTYKFAGRVVKRTPFVTDGGDGQRAFVAFNEGQDQEDMLNAAWADTHDVPQRKHRRYPGGGDVRYATIEHPSREVRGRILDVSPGGCRLKGPVALPVGARVRVNVLGLTLDGQIRWSTPGNEMGIEFSRPDLVVQALLDKSPGVAEAEG